ncbi:nucleosome assembly protein, putative [Perkinsus marinus ATCC 50983]|uniref:Nucleosome assembly protein, putative n=1 Tax=Perkinsus marinus (strain ATCC 50983 / TXsc) TaxID=423536 RepID=C5M0H7_PERM5|nr:nucleosome assembly protein, putative [Perkinsus marinus ATCC 50983]EEQ97512.1 nucleosome assembly protein, putative [Perkinsus marinus ATCC 50983]|eukprot:XP_002764795.1 nucleosome assembly protein, putative [Perkinsus marinus ATCC 50983]
MSTVTAAEGEEAPPLPDELISKLIALDEDYTAIQKKLEREIRALERSYDKQLLPIIEARGRLLSTEGGSNRGRGFWKKVLHNSAEFEDDIEEWDLPVLEYLVDVRANVIISRMDGDDPRGFTITFVFEENPYFSNDELTKKYHYGEGKDFLKETQIVEIESDAIQWKPGMDVTVETVKKRKKGMVKTVTRARPSFFQFFTSLGPNHPIPEWLESMYEEEEEDDDDEVDRLHMVMADDWERAEMLKDNIIPHAIRWYTGEACSEDEEDEEGSEYTIEEDDEVAVIAVAEANF